MTTRVRSLIAAALLPQKQQRSLQLELQGRQDTRITEAFLNSMLRTLCTASMLGSKLLWSCFHRINSTRCSTLITALNSTCLFVSIFRLQNRYLINSLLPCNKWRFSTSRTRKCDDCFEFTVSPARRTACKKVQNGPAQSLPSRQSLRRSLPIPILYSADTDGIKLQARPPFAYTRSLRGTFHLWQKNLTEKFQDPSIFRCWQD